MPQSGSVKENLQQSSAGLVARKWLIQGYPGPADGGPDTAAIPHVTMLPFALPGTKPGVVLTPIPSWCKALTAAACHPYHG
jgi:hypothetical protein